ncbi:hypothetical protein ACFQ0K_07260 [Nocardioides caeni]|uniref:Uncharacterized protein n=1 Tax=Nocardioides caeni TaxID=574700 RepID=A0A4S8N236_9ACTN|nr:hypothetical protein [Nocardioides caeni]THV08874.1 hypothetical protein E9934_18525 [Nocardioides caeni]
MGFAPLATLSDYRGYRGDENATVGALTLRRPSSVVRTALVGFTPYATDDDSVPVDAKVKATLAEAVCAQVAYWDEAGETGTALTKGSRVRPS